MRADRYYILAFDSTHAALSAQRRLQGRVAASVMPTLRAIQAGCGIPVAGAGPWGLAAVFCRGRRRARGHGCGLV